MWDYKVADVLSIRESLMNIDWYLEPNVITCLIGRQVHRNILSIIAENVPDRFITVNGKDPLWITKEVKTAISRKLFTTNT